MHLALINIARARYPIEDKRMGGFTSKLDSVNAAAERSEGFVWRLVSTGSDASVTSLEDPSIIVNMAVWESLKALQEYTYHTVHMRVFSSRNEWFETLEGPHMALWWIKRGDIPDVPEGQRRLAWLNANGPSPKAFTFGSPFDGAGVPLTID